MDITNFLWGVMLLPIGYIWKQGMNTQKELSEHKDTSMTKQDINQLIDLKDEPIKVQLHYLSNQSDRILELLEKQQHGKG